MKAGTIHTELLCWLDLLVTPVYLTLTLAAASSLAIPTLRDLASHGKTRNSPQAKAPALGSGGVFRLLEELLHSDRFLIRKSRFVDFYVCGLISLAATILNIHTTDRFSSLLSSTPIALLAIHLCRRCYECCFVHRSRPHSKMHVSGYLLGMLHYLLLPLVFLPQSCNTDEFLSRPRHSSTLLTIAATLFCVWAQYQQFRHHCLLAQLRPLATDKTAYRLPVGGWFQFVACPHYLAEILIYVSFAALLEIQFDQPVRHGGRHWILLVWVATNLTVSAWQSHQWYRQHVANYEKLRRRAIIPFVF